ncbi:MAG: aconitate hydratase [Candidatus Theseobacter exili]|nr:aconitate hydratase [Candidatus Theseobacter exili]
MGLNLAQKIIEKHLVEGQMIPGQEIGIRIDQTLTQDATGTMAYLQFECMGKERVQTELSVSYIDHNTLQSGFENADDHRYLQSVAAKYGVHFSRPGNGICHQVHLERFGIPGKTLLGSDSHTPTGGGIGMLAIGAGGLSVAAAMAGMPFYMKMPYIVGIELIGKLNPWVTAKDIILEVLKLLSVKGGVGKVMEYYGSGVETLTVPQRATVTNMGAELGATSSVFPSDDKTLEFMKAQKREGDWQELKPDSDAAYDEVVQINLSLIEPLVACPDSPDNVKTVRELAGLKIHQVAIGSCTNSSYSDLVKTANILKGKKIDAAVSLVISPGSRQVMEMLARDGVLADIISSGARILETTCGPCIGMGQAPPSGSATLRSFNRNFKGRSGTKDAGIYLASPEVCAATALCGVLTDPRDLGDFEPVNEPDRYLVDDGMIIPPVSDGGAVDILRGPNIAPCPQRESLQASIAGKVLIKVADNITTDHILPGGAKVLPYRSNIPRIADLFFQE